jgi:mannose-6-phosphate isomerase-like protein (cupin superfamily)
MSADDLQRLWFINTLVIIRVPPELGKDGTCVMEHHAPMGDSPPLHVHHDQDEIFVLLAGKATIHLSGRDIEAHVGDCLLVPKGERHSYLATSADGVRFLTITRGDGFVGLVARTRPRGGERRPTQTFRAPFAEGRRSPGTNRPEAWRRICRAAAWLRMAPACAPGVLAVTLHAAA